MQYYVQIAANYQLTSIYQ